MNDLPPTVPAVASGGEDDGLRVAAIKREQAERLICRTELARQQLHAVMLDLGSCASYANIEGDPAPLLAARRRALDVLEQVADRLRGGI